MRQRYVVRVTRADGSVTFKGPLPVDRAERERDAWLSTGDHAAELAMPDHADYVAWCRWLAANVRALPSGIRFFPAVTSGHAGAVAAGGRGAR